MTDEKKIEFNFNVEEMIDTQAIAKRVTEKLHDDIANSVLWNVRQHVETKVAELIKPEIETLINAQKEAILQALAQAMPAIAKALAERAISTASEQLDGYYGKDILKKIFGA